MKGVLDNSAIAARLAALPGWRLDQGRLFRVFEFATFSEAFGFMAAVAVVAEKLDHHPDWCNAWNKVSVHLVSHDVSGITERDFRLAERMNALYRESET